MRLKYIALIKEVHAMIMQVTKAELQTRKEKAKIDKMLRIANISASTSIHTLLLYGNTAPSIHLDWKELP